MFVFVFGESGLGKELVVWVFYVCLGCKGNLIVVNCGVFLFDLVESEFFGYVVGVFMGVSKVSEGFFVVV